MANAPTPSIDQWMKSVDSTNQAQDQALAANKATDDRQDATDAAQDKKLADLQAQIDALKAQAQPPVEPQPDPPSPQEPPAQPPAADPTRLEYPPGTIWTLGPNGETLKNGQQFAGGWGTEYRLVDGVVQVLGIQNSGWWAAVDGGWISVGFDNPAPAPQPEPAPPADPAPQPVPSGNPSIVNLAIYRRGRTGALPKIIRSLADLTAAKLVLPYSRSSALKAAPLDALTYKPGDYPGMAKYMGSTGERREIGLETEDTAEWLMGGDPNNMLCMAEGHGSVPVHCLVDGKIVDLFKYPKATTDYRAPKNGWTPYFDVTPLASDKAAVQADVAHYPSLSYVPYLATLDPYHLEEMQFAATAAIITTTPPLVPGVLLPLQQRQFAWGIRAIIQAYIATLEAEKIGPLPAICHPSAYWKQMLDANIAFYSDRYINKGGPLVQEMGFLACDDMLYLTPWQQDYISIVLGWAVWTGKVPQIKPLYDFQIRQAVKRATGPLRSCAIQYNVPKGAGSTWAETLAMNGYAPTADDHYPDSVSNNPDYLGYLRGALRVAVMNGVPGAEEAFTYAEAEARRKSFITRRWAVA